MSTIQVDIVSAEGEIFAGDANMVVAPAIEGDLGVAPNHTPLLTKLRAGEIRVLRDGEPELPIFVGGGIIEIQPSKVMVLADTAVRADDLDEAAALAAKQAAEEAMESAEAGSEDMDSAQAALAASLQQLKMMEKYRKRGMK